MRRIVTGRQMLGMLLIIRMMLIVLKNLLVGRNMATLKVMLCDGCL